MATTPACRSGAQTGLHHGGGGGAFNVVYNDIVIMTMSHGPFWLGALFGVTLPWRCRGLLMDRHLENGQAVEFTIAIRGSDMLDKGRNS